MSLRKDLAAYDFNIRILEDTPRGNVWIYTVSTPLATTNSVQSLPNVHSVTTAMTTLFDAIDPRSFRSYVFWSAVLVFKMLMMSYLTGRKRFGKKVFANPEDAAMTGANGVRTDPEVERVRRAHQNDVENIPLFVAIGFLYLLTGPDVTLAVTLFRLVGIARIVHTLVYAVVVVRQPARMVAWFLAYIPTIYMTLATVVNFCCDPKN
ncbi:hypothetical protein pipiens_000217, partial [Culex pipiens pipiens]